MDDVNQKSQPLIGSLRMLMVLAARQDLQAVWVCLVFPPFGQQMQS